MIEVLTDEEMVAYAETLIQKTASAIRMTRILHPGASIEALSQVLFMVNGASWMDATDMARVRLLAKKMEAGNAGCAELG